MSPALNQLVQLYFLVESNFHETHLDWDELCCQVKLERITVKHYGDRQNRCAIRLPFWDDTGLNLSATISLSSKS